MKYQYKAPFNAILLRYNEIGIKGGNRWMFERKLLDNIRTKLKVIPNLSFYKDRGRFALVHEDDSAFSDEELQLIRAELGKVFGLESYSPGFQVEPDWEEIHETILENVPQVYEVHNAACKEGETIPYRTRSRRSFKKFPYTSNEMEVMLAEELLEKWPNLKVDLGSPELEIGLEIREDSAFIFFESLPGPKGLPVGSGDKVLALMSGGIDSPVACNRAMQRGSHVDYLTFHSHPYTSKDVLEKIAKLVNICDEFQDYPGKYYACNLVEAQKMIRDRCIPKFRTILYRRMMMRISTVVSRVLKSSALLTGESVAQVASQTLSNMDCINRATDMLILRPLVSMDKNETIQLAEKIGTFETSNIPAADSCTTFAPKKAATSSNMHILTKSEKRLDMDDVIRACLKDTVLIDQQTMEETEQPKLLEVFEKHFAGRWEVTEDMDESPS
ncbi:MAG: tRNA 4-thiouridine(8) synthase ThiI [Lentisphaeraceae bacterium]|nr:tRNA 4-thiouridine(8) synthase ThiI [Lentisphaeraceae bacterium]